MNRLNARLNDASDAYPNSDATWDSGIYSFRNHDAASRSLQRDPQIGAALARIHRSATVMARLADIAQEIIVGQLAAE